MKKCWIIGLLLCGFTAVAAPEAHRIYLSGTGPDDAVEWDFFCSKGRKSDGWTKIPVPSNWEQQGFGNYNYGHDIPKHDETGTYRIPFMVSNDWKDKHVRLVFEGVMTQAEVKINGKPIGVPNMGGYIPFRFNLDEPLLKYGEENELEVLVKKMPDNDSLDLGERKADYWVFGGIYRPVYLEVQPKEFVNRVAIDARADGTFRMDVFPQVHRPTKFREDSQIHVDEVQAQIQTLDGEEFGEPMTAEIHGAAGRIRLKTQVKNPALWSPEFPNLYQVRVTLLKEGTAISQKVERFGFRTFEVRKKDGFYLNGKKIRVRGVNRNVFDPQHGRTVSKERVWNDARAIKAMNANLVRSHLPPTLEFMRACDELGLMTIAELTTWQHPVIDTLIARNIAYEIVTTYQNSPSMILWANGNEGGFNLDVDELYHLVDLQDRPVIHPWALFEGIETKHYPTYQMLLDTLNRENIYLTTEFQHGLYDGGHGAGLEDYWNAIRNSPNGVGGILWCWADAAISRTDLDGKPDTDGNHSADGIVGPNGEKEGSYYTIREIWSPIQIPLDALPADFDGTLPVENRYDWTPLSDCSFRWRLLDFSSPLSAKAETTVHAQGRLSGPPVAPARTGELTLPLPAGWQSADALELTAIGTDGVEIMHWSWPIGSSKPVAADSDVKPQPQNGNPFDVKLGDTLWSFSPETGQLLSCSVNGKATGLGCGPVLYATTEEGSLRFSNGWKTKVSRNGDAVVIESKNSEDDSSFQWTLSPGGSVELSYSFAPITNALTSCAVGFDLPDEAVLSKRWLGGGPYRIWANRTKGPHYGLWENEFNDTATGDEWVYPEFKGVFDQVDWMRLNLACGGALLVDTAPGSQVGVLRPSNKVTPPGKPDRHFGPRTATWDYPEQGGLFLFHKVPAVGAKFRGANSKGPQSVPKILSGPISGRVVFRTQ
jgi:hypothetical protein